MTNLSTTLMVSSGIEGGVKDKVNSASVNSQKEFHVTHAVFFPSPVNAETVSQPVPTKTTVLVFLS